MPIVADFTVIQDGNVTIGDNNASFIKTFSTGGRHNSSAMLMLNVRGLADGHAAVRINGDFQKALQPHADGDSSRWYSQHMVLPSSLLSPNANQNELRIDRVEENDNVSGSFDDFVIRDVVIFFHQQA